MKSAYLLQRLHSKRECDEGTAPAPKKTAFGVLNSALVRVRAADDETVGMRRGTISVWQRVCQAESHAPLPHGHVVSMDQKIQTRRVV